MAGMTKSKAERTHGDLVVCKIAVRYRDSPTRVSGERPKKEELNVREMKLARSANQAGEALR